MRRAFWWLQGMRCALPHNKIGDALPLMRGLYVVVAGRSANGVEPEDGVP